MEAFQIFQHKGVALPLFEYEPEPPQPPRTPSPRAPGAGRFELDRIGLVRHGEELTLAARIEGRNLAYLYTEILLKEPGQDRFYGPVAREHVQAEHSKMTHGISRPRWSNPIQLVVSFRPSLRLLTDGVDSAFCFAFPGRYGDTDYRLDGLYAPAGGSEPLRAVLEFDRTGELKGVMASGRDGGRSTPRGLVPRPGDRFRPFVQILTPPGEEGSWNVTTGLSAQVTHRNQPPYVVRETLIPGDYLVGLVAEDMDGGLAREYLPMALGT